MDRLIYTALSGLGARGRQQQVTANNLANAIVPGFRREVVAAEGRYLAGDAWPARVQAGSPSLTTPHEAGQVTATGNEMDIALAGEAWLAVQGPIIGGQISEGYTRRGDLSVSPAGLLTNGDGRVVVGDNGAPISVPPGAAVQIGSDGNITARLGDAVTPLGRLKLVDGTSLKSRDKAGDSLFVTDLPLPRDQAARLQPGALESANVQAAHALAELVEEQRGFEVNARMLSVAKEIDEKGARLMALDN
ncbi:flagellar hook-basal body complex protein [Sandarakinorhabdus sp.]|uniref:flagellar basal body rod protein FlgF n=1 Tax=Sandarakinorhabdus sp. TaxID=1916663 RepID=UPI00286E1AFA|nr:flagellar hook-basal body complex protein [Sandarakinorhabdus sp.]